MAGGSGNASSGYTAKWTAAFPYLTAVNTAGQPAQAPSGLQNIPSTNADAPGTEFDGKGIAPTGTDNAGNGVQPNGVSATPAANLTNIANALNAAAGNNGVPVFAVSRGGQTSAV
jgi:hypothetical protein